MRLTRPRSRAVGGGAVDRRGDAVGAELVAALAALIQSVVQAGASWRLSFRLATPFARRAFSMSRLMIAVAGQPE